MASLCRDLRELLSSLPEARRAELCQSAGLEVVGDIIEREWLRELALMPIAYLKCVLSFHSRHDVSGYEVVRPIVCPECGEVCNGERGLAIHRARMHSARPLADVSDLKCPLCQQQFTRRDTLLRHVRQRCTASLEARAQALQVSVDQIPRAPRAPPAVLRRPAAVLRRPAAASHDEDGD
eukprot:5010557-Pyramimonas_sp.AAC.1